MFQERKFVNLADIFSRDAWAFLLLKKYFLIASDAQLSEEEKS